VFCLFFGKSLQLTSESALLALGSSLSRHNR
jgi:hypothetical protein